MTNDYSVDDLLDFLNHAGDRGLMPTASARALAVATRNVFGVLEEDEQKNIGKLDLDAVIKRFNNKRARDFNPGSLKEYARRVRKAIELFEEWKSNPADFSVKTRTSRRSKSEPSSEKISRPTNSFPETQASTGQSGTYQSSFPIRAGRVITLLNVPEDLTSAEAEKLAQFVKMLAVE